MQGQHHLVFPSVPVHLVSACAKVAAASARRNPRIGGKGTADLCGDLASFRYRDFESIEPFMRRHGVVIAGDFSYPVTQINRCCAPARGPPMRQLSASYTFASERANL